MAYLLLLFILVPIVELTLLIEIGRHIGTLATLGLIFGTGLLGAALARHQGLGTLARMQSEVRQGRLPADALVDGVLILIAAAVLMTPGILTDAFGFMCLIPACRGWLKGYLRKRLKRAVEKGAVKISFDFGSVRSDEPGRRPMKDVTPRSPSEPQEDELSPPKLDGR